MLTTPKLRSRNGCPAAAPIASRDPRSAIRAFLPYASVRVRVALMDTEVCTTTAPA
jgi:hypothetical protein